jgi:hypothetical protein
MNIMEPENFIDETVIVRGVNIENVYDDCLSWIQIYQTNLFEEKPTTIHGTFGREIRRIPRHGVDVDISLKYDEQNHDPTNVIVRIRIHRPEWSNIVSRNNYHYPLYELVEEFWRHVGIKLTDNVLRHIYPIPIIDKITSKYILDFFIQTPIPTLGFLGLLWILPLFFKNPFGFFVISLSAVGCLYLLRHSSWFTLQQIRKFRELKRFLYPDTST